MTELVVVSAADEAALLAEIARLVAFLDRVPDVPFLDVAYTRVGCRNDLKIGRYR